MVSSFCHEIIRRQPSGPYHLGGWSAGGAFAFAVASHLIQTGAEVYSLIIIDSPVPRKLGTLPSGFYEYCGRRGLFGGDVPPASLIPHFLRTMETMLPYQAVPLQAARVPNVGIIWACETVMDADDAPDLGLKMGRDHFMLKRRQEFGPDGWEKLLPGAEFTLAKVVGADHFTMMVSCPALSFSKKGNGVLTDYR
ncbi:polyketide synthase [Penicillium canariense]|uniref:Polyketide synthase n=1 Tax=Penicillium canariense TaxID=189055 RepID=A0A9W9HN39_9EURO|nr:polyketide synthase [Penicillium canariense]KAJ5151396.1 polyketide synthase [Penicillium canariense]